MIQRLKLVSRVGLPLPLSLSSSCRAPLANSARVARCDELAGVLVYFLSTIFSLTARIICTHTYVPLPLSKSFRRLACLFACNTLKEKVLCTPQCLILTLWTYQCEQLRIWVLIKIIWINVNVGITMTAELSTVIRNSIYIPIYEHDLLIGLL